MIQRVDQAATDVAPRATTRSTGGSGTFDTMHAAALAKVGARAAAAKVTPPTPPAGETWVPVADTRYYAKIAGGPRAGSYINLGTGEHHGETFTIEQRAGTTVHVYGTGASEQVVDAATEAAAQAKPTATAAADPPAKGETWGPVAGHWGYADILDGKRNGLYVNTSGGAREGMAFQIVKRHGREFHVYGQGADRQIFEVGRHETAATTPAATTKPAAAATPAAATGGTSPAASIGG